MQASEGRRRPKRDQFVSDVGLTYSAERSIVSAVAVVRETFINRVFHLLLWVRGVTCEASVSFKNESSVAPLATCLEPQLSRFSHSLCACRSFSHAAWCLQIRLLISIDLDSKIASKMFHKQTARSSTKYLRSHCAACSRSAIKAERENNFNSNSRT